MKRTFLEWRREYKQDEVRKCFDEIKDRLDEDMLNAPLKDILFLNRAPFVEAVGDGAICFKILVSQYIVENKLDLDENVTLKEAVDAITYKEPADSL